MSRLARLAWLLTALAAAGPVAAQRQAPVDRIVAIVNKEVITAGELRERVELAERELRRRNTPLPERVLLERQIVERLVLEKVQLQLAGESGIRIDEQQLDRALARVAENNKLTPAEFRQALERDNIPYNAFREDVRQQIALQRLREREVDSKIEVSETEIDLFLEEHQTGGPERVEYNVSHILVRLPDQASPERIEQARARAQKAREELRSGGDFARVAAVYSDAADALQGGQMGWRERSRMPDLFANALQAMKPGEVSEVLRSPAGFHLLKLEDRRGSVAGGPSVMQTHARHILIRTSEIVSEADAERRLRDLRERVVTGGADFAELARLHSGDASASRGGDLGWVFPGDTVPEFERAMDALAPKQVSPPVKSPFGWHLIQVLERRTGALPPERLRLGARQALRERKSEEAYQEWLRQLRDRAYVEIRLEEK